MLAVYFTVFVFPPPRLKNGSVAACQSALNQERTAVNLLNKRWVFLFPFSSGKGNIFQFDPDCLLDANSYEPPLPQS